MNPPVTPSELRSAAAELRPQLVRATAFSILAGLLVLAPTGYMFAVYDRVLNSRSPTTLAMLTLLVLGAYVVMEVLEWARGELLREAALSSIAGSRTGCSRRSSRRTAATCPAARLSR